jgi:hypothetical protein
VATLDLKAEMAKRLAALIKEKATAATTTTAAVTTTPATNVALGLNAQAASLTPSAVAAPAVSTTTKTTLATVSNTAFDMANAMAALLRERVNNAITTTVVNGVNLATSNSINGALTPVAGSTIGIIPKTNTYPTPIGNTLRSTIAVDSVINDIINGAPGSNVQKLLTPDFNSFAKNYTNSAPNILFICEYIVDNANIGLLIVFEKFYNSSHYEVFKRNVFSDNTFQRILFLDSENLKKETSYYIPYLKDVLGISLEDDSYYVIFDPIIKNDRIYEYKIRASKVPLTVDEVDFDSILISKNLITKVDVNVAKIQSVFTFASNVFNNSNLAWVVALLNEDVDFFGVNAKEVTQLGSILVKENGETLPGLLIPKDTNDILEIYKISVSFFGVQKTIRHILKTLGGLSDEFKDVVVNSIDASSSRFSYDLFLNGIRDISPALNLILSISESGNTLAVDRLSTISIKIPTSTGSESLSSIESLTKVFAFINSVYLDVLYGKENIEGIRRILRPVLRIDAESGKYYDLNDGFWDKPVPAEAIIISFNENYDPVTGNVYGSDGVLKRHIDDAIPAFVAPITD